MRRFDDKVVLITGAASGIGRATALRLAEEGAALVCVDVQEDALAETAAAARERGAAAVHTARCDVREPADVAAAVARCITAERKLDAVCNLAGVLQFQHSHEVALEDWNRILAVNLTGTFLVCQAAIPHLLVTRGCIVNTSSTAALSAHPWTAAYSASKGGVLALTYTLALEYAKQGIRVNAVCPGGIKTPIQDVFALPEGANAKLLRRLMPLNDFGPPETAAAAIAFLASDDAAYINGTALRVDGGMLA